MKKTPHIRIILWLMVGLYIGYFSLFTVLRIRALYAHYFDLGIMHQAVYNTYRAMQTFDWSRVLEISNPHGTGFVKRMAIHNDVLLALLAPFYFLFSGPQTLVILQSIVLGLGAFAVFGIAREVLRSNKYRDSLGLIFAFAYLMYVPMQRANIFDFHAVTFATTLLLYMFYFWLKKKFLAGFACFIFALLTKEHIGVTTFLLGLVMLLPHRDHQLTTSWKKSRVLFPTAVILISLVWFALSMLVIIPFFRGANHFALERFTVLKDPAGIWKYIFHRDTFMYFLYLLGPLAFLSLLSPLYLFVSGFEFAINLLSNSWNMRNIIYHYTSVIQPFVFISAIYGTNRLFALFSKFKKEKQLAAGIAVTVVFLTLVFSYYKGPLPYSREGDTYPINRPAAGAQTVWDLSNTLKDEAISVASTGHLAPFFTSRRNYYHFAVEYEKADYVVIQMSELYNYFDQEVDMEGTYRKLQGDNRFVLLFQSPAIEVYKKLPVNK